MGNDRRLTYSGRHVTKLIHDVAYPDTPGVSISGDNWLHDEKRQYCIELTGTEFTDVLSALMVGALTTNPDNAHRISWLLLQFIEYPMECGITIETIEREVIRYLESENEESDQDDMACLEIVQFGGISYLKQNCGCAETRLFQLSQVSLADGVPTSIDDGGADDGGFVADDVSEANASCYAENATEYLVNRSFAFSEFMIDLAAGAIDIAAGEYDEIYNTAVLIVEFLTGDTDLNEIGSFTKSQVEAALKSSANIEALELAWTFTGDVTRNDLKEWVGHAPSIINGVPVRMIMQTWVRWIIMFFVRRGLNKIAAECESGSNLPILINVPLPIEDASEYWISKEFRWQDSFFSPNTADDHVFNDFSGLYPGAIGMFVEYDVNGGGGNGDIAAIGDGNSLWGAQAFIDPDGGENDGLSFWGDDGDEDLWTDNGDYTRIAAIDSADITGGTYNVTARTTGNNVTVTWDFRIRFLIDAVVQPFPE